MKLIMAAQNNLKGTIRTIHQKVREYIGEELWGDLWEEHHRLLKKKMPIMVAQLLTIYMYIQMVWAKCQISFQNRIDNYYCGQDKYQKIKSSELSKYRINHSSKSRQITSAISSSLRMLKIPVITILLIFLLVIFSNSIDANSLKPAIKMPVLESPVQAATQPQRELKEAQFKQTEAELRQQEAESKQRAATLRQEKAESKQKAAESRQKKAESEQKIAELRQKTTKAQHWLQVAKQEEEQAQHWLQVAKQEEERAQHWLQVAQNEREKLSKVF